MFLHALKTEFGFEYRPSSRLYIIYEFAACVFDDAILIIRSYDSIYCAALLHSCRRVVCLSFVYDFTALSRTFLRLRAVPRDGSDDIIR